MIKLLSSANFTEIGMLKSQIESEGIPCVTRNEHISAVSGSVPFFECYPELWVLHDADYDSAKRLLDKWQNAANDEMAPWLCPGCAEEIEGQFESCWQCGAAKE
jgi:hypothetical protein